MRHWSSFAVYVFVLLICAGRVKIAASQLFSLELQFDHERFGHTEKIELNMAFPISAEVQKLCNKFILWQVSCSGLQQKIEAAVGYHFENTSYPNNVERMRFKTAVSSFDIFDTIITRDVVQPENIFELVEREFPADNFKEARIYAQSLSNGTFDDIYEKLYQFSGATREVVERLQDFEFSLEVNHSYLILQNYNRIQDGDILVSDMYLSFDRIWKILISCGFKKQVNIYISPQGKGEGWMWDTLLSLYQITHHLGDNIHSDILQAQKKGITAEFTHAHALNSVELALQSLGQEGETLALIIRKHRHMNPYQIHSIESKLYVEQSALNIPILLFVAEQLVDIMKTEVLDTLLLTTRDGCLLEKVFEYFYPDVHTVRFHVSRHMYQKPTHAFISYIQSVYNPNRTLIYDSGGSFKTGRPLFQKTFGTLPRVHLFCYDSLQGTEFASLTYSIKIVPEGDIPFCREIEMLNSNIVGHLVDVFHTGSETKFVRSPLQSYRVEHASVHHQAVLSFCTSVNIQQTRTAVHSLFSNLKPSSVIFEKLGLTIFDRAVLGETFLSIGKFMHLATHYSLQSASHLEGGMANYTWDWHRFSNILAVEFQTIYDKPAHIMSIVTSILPLGVAQEQNQLTSDILRRYLGADMFKFSSLNFIRQGLNIEATLQISGHARKQKAQLHQTSEIGSAVLANIALQLFKEYYSQRETLDFLPVFDAVLEIQDQCFTSWNKILGLHNQLNTNMYMTSSSVYIVQRNCHQFVMNPNEQETFVEENRNHVFDSVPEIPNNSFQYGAMNSLSLQCYGCTTPSHSKCTISALPKGSLFKADSVFAEMQFLNSCDSDHWTMMDPDSFLWDLCAIRRVH